MHYLFLYLKNVTLVKVFLKLYRVVTYRLQLHT